MIEPTGAGAPHRVQFFSYLVSGIPIADLNIRTFLLYHKNSWLHSDDFYCLYDFVMYITLKIPLLKQGVLVDYSGVCVARSLSDKNYQKI